MTSQENHRDEFVGRPRVNWASTREEQWDLLQVRLNSRTSRKTYSWAVAASVAILALAGLFAGFYEVKFDVPYGERLSLELPDGSTVDLNAGSSFSYKPFMWYLSRNATLEGEAYFEVEKGNTFTIISRSGSTTVVGTRFNIFSRGDIYLVHCLEGIVRVEDLKGNDNLLNAREKASISPLGIDVAEAEGNDAIGWINAEFTFTDTPIFRVLEEIERQFNLNIEYTGEPLYYTGSFTGEMDIDTILHLISRPFGLKVVSKGEGSYLLKGE